MDSSRRAGSGQGKERITKNASHPGANRRVESRSVHSARRCIPQRFRPRTRTPISPVRVRSPALLLARERHRPELVGVAARVALGVEAHLARGESTRRLMAWTWPTSSRSRGSVTSRRWSRILKSVAQRSFARW